MILVFDVPAFSDLGEDCCGWFLRTAIQEDASSMSLVAGFLIGADSIDLNEGLYAGEVDLHGCHCEGSDGSAVDAAMV